MDKSVYQFISKQTGDPIVQRRTCPRTGQEFAIFQGDVELLDKISPIIWGKKIPIPLPTLSPSARMRRRMLFRNERGLYPCTSALSGKKVISVYHPEMVAQVINQQEAFSDAYTPFDYGVSYDDTRSFFDQYRQLRKNIPRPGVININNTNGEYNTFSSDSKNIYLCADTMRCEDVLYSTTIKYVKNGADLLNIWSSDYVYECVSSHHLTKCINVWYSESCYDCWFLSTCKNCTSCFLCTNISDKKNYILNKPATEEEIRDFKKMMRSASGLEKIKKQFQQLRDTEPRPGNMMLHSEHSVGSVLNNCQDAFLCFDSHDLQNCRYCHVGEFNADTMDCTIFNPKASQVYEQVCGGSLQKSAFDITCRESSDVFLSEFIMYSNHMLGCINMHNADYCILNKKYSPAERDILAWTIIESLRQEGKRGEFFDTTLSPFPYNDTVAMDYFPVQKVVRPDGKEEIVEESWTGTVYLQSDAFITSAELDLWWTKRIPIHRRTKNYEINIPSNAKVINAKDLPGSIDEVNDDISSYVILCAETGRPYQITPIELKIYRTLGISLPRLHHSVRHTMRIRRRPGKEFYLRNCSATGEQMLSLYPPDTSYPVYSWKVFEKLVYW